MLVMQLYVTAAAQHESSQMFIFFATMLPLDSQGLTGVG